MDELITAYLAAVGNGNEAEAQRLLDEMNAATDLKFEDTTAKLDELANGLLGLFEAANELVAEYA